MRRNLCTFVCVCVRSEPVSTARDSVFHHSSISHVSGWSWWWCCCCLLALLHLLLPGQVFQFLLVVLPSVVVVFFFFSILKNINILIRIYFPTLAYPYFELYLERHKQILSSKHMSVAAAAACGVVVGTFVAKLTHSHTQPIKYR